MSLRKLLVLVPAVSSTLAVAACGSSSKPKATTTTAAPATSSSAQPTTAGRGASSTTGPVRATLRGHSYSPVANKLWPYSVQVTDASGKPLDGTVETEFAFAGQVVGREVPPTHALKNGVLHDNVTFPSASVGQPIELQTVVHTSQGSVTLDWPVAVKP